MVTYRPELVVLVPVLDRPQNVKPLVESFLTSGTPGELWFICEIDDISERIELESYLGLARIKVLPVVAAHTWPEKINTGVDFVDADWYLCAADDVTFGKGWWDTTLNLRTNPTVGVIGTNDSPNGTGNPRVAVGQHTCHPLMARWYIDLGTIDEPGLATHDGYHHWFVDDELVWTAKIRGAWAYCQEAIIEHHHPYWDPTIPVDNTYQLGEANSETDKELWCARAQLLGLNPQ